MEMERIHDAARRGDVKCLAKIRNANPGIRLDDAKFTSFLRNPLHIAAMLGHVEFAQEVMRLSPSLASMVDSKGFTPLHLASTRNNVQMVKVLLDANEDACTALDQDGRTPLHLAAMRNEVEVMGLLIAKKPEAIDQVQANRGDTTILHFCVKHNKFKALKKLVGHLVDAQGQHPISVNSKDIDGNTILHLAAQRRRIKMIEYLLESNNIGVDINIQNHERLRGLQMLAPKEMNDQAQKEMDDLEIGCFDYQQAVVRQKKSSSSSVWLKERVNTLMVVAILIAGIAFQAAVNPPGGVFQEDSKVDSNTDPLMFTYYLNAVMNDNSMSDKFGSYLQNLPQQTPRSRSSNTSTTTAEIITDSANFVKALLNTTLIDDSYTATKSAYTADLAPGIVLHGNRWMSIISNYSSVNTGGAGFFPYLIRYAGSTILAYRYPTTYQVYMTANGLALLLSLFMILLVVSGVIDDQSIPQVRLLALLMAVSISCIITSYISVFNIMSPPFYSSDLIGWSILACFAVWIGGGIACLIYTLVIKRVDKSHSRQLDRDRLQQYAKRRPYFKDLILEGKCHKSAFMNPARLFVLVAVSAMFLAAIQIIASSAQRRYTLASHV